MNNRLTWLETSLPSLCAATVLFCSQANANIYYVSPNGLDTNNGLAVGTPFQTIQAAANITQPGDSVQVMTGTYGANPAWWHQAALVISNSGTARRPITFMNYPGNHPIITTATNPMVWDTVDILGSYIRFQGFEVIGKAQSVTLAQATQTAATEQQAYLQSLAAHALQSTVPVAYPVDAVTNGNCIQTNRTVGVAIVKNIVHDCSASGIVAQMSDYIFIESNVVYNTSWWTVYDTSGINIHNMKNSDNTTGYRNIIVNNISHDNANTQAYYNPNFGDGVPTDGNGIIIDSNQVTDDGQPYVGRTLLMANIAYNNGGTGMHTYLSAHVDILNNTGFMNNVCPVSGSTCGNLNAGQILANASDDINLYNNILYSPPTRRPYTNWKNTHYSEGHNIIFTVGGQPVGYVYPLDPSDITSDPLFGNPASLETSSAPPAMDAYDAANPVQAMWLLRPLKASPARNAGTIYLTNGTPMTVIPTGMDGTYGATPSIGALAAPSGR